MIEHSSCLLKKMLLFTFMVAVFLPAFSFSALCSQWQELSRNEGITLRWMIYGNTYSDTAQIVSQFNDELQAVFPGVSIELEIVPLSGYANSWETKMAANEQVDIAWMGSEVLDFSAEVKKGNLMALDYLLTAYGDDLTSLIPKEEWNRQKRDTDMTYGIPVLGPLYRTNRALITNKTLAERYADWNRIVSINQKSQYTTRESLEPITEYLLNLKKHNALGEGVSYSTLSKMADKGYEGMYGEDSPFVIRIFDKTPVVYNKYTLPSYYDYYETMAQWYQAGYIRSDAAYQLNPTEEDGKKSGNILFLEETGDNMSVYTGTQTEYDALDGDLEGYHYISWETNRNCLVIPKSSNYPAQAMQVINYLHSAEGRDLYRLLVNGLEKKQYIRVSDDSDVIARMTGDDRTYRYGLIPTTIGDIYQNYELAEGQFETIRENNEDALHSSLEGFDLDVRMISIEMAKIDRVVEKYAGTLNQGSSEDWKETYHNFLQDMNKAGSTKVIREMQRQVDAFMGK